jgi:protein SCO1
MPQRLIHWLHRLRENSRGAFRTLVLASLFTLPILGMKQAYRSLSAAPVAPAASRVAQDAAGLPAAPAGGETRWGADCFPNVELTTHEGRRVRFFDDLIQGKVVLINFIFTSCTNACPLETARLVNLQQILGERVGRDVFMYSISIDPDNDTVEKLADYASKFGVGPGWSFLRGSVSDVILLRKKLGLLAKADEALKDHNLSLIIGNQSTGRWMKRSPFESPYYLAAQIGGWLHNWTVPETALTSSVEPPKIRPMSVGENLFRSRCAPCHSLASASAGSSAPGYVPVGPDLLGITERRDPAWLFRWLKQPDAMLAEKDPIAMNLLAQYRQLPMPNLQLNDTEVNAVIEYLRHAPP